MRPRARARRDRFPVPALTARAQRPVRVDGEVAELGAEVVGAAVHPAVEQHPAADAGTERDEQACCAPRAPRRTSTSPSVATFASLSTTTARPVAAASASRTARLPDVRQVRRVDARCPSRSTRPATPTPIGFVAGAPARATIVGARRDERVEARVRRRAPRFLARSSRRRRAETPSTFVPPMSSPMRVHGSAESSSVVDVDAADVRARRSCVGRTVALFGDEVVGRVDQLAHRLQELVRRVPEMLDRVVGGGSESDRVITELHNEAVADERAPATARRTRLSGSTEARRCGPTVSTSSSSVRPSSTSSRSANGRCTDSEHRRRRRPRRGTAPTYESRAATSSSP